MKEEKKIKEITTQIKQLGILMKGTVVEKKIICGKGNCRCKRGEEHIGVYLTYSLEGKTKTVYVPKGIIKEVKEWSTNYNRFKKLLERLFKIQIKIIKRGRIDNKL